MTVRDFIDCLDAISATPGASYQWMKLIDQYPGEGTFPIMGGRVRMFTGIRVRQAFYEPLSDYDTILLSQHVAARQAASGVPEWQGDHVGISFEIFPSAYTAPKGRLLLPRPNEPTAGFHMVRRIGWDDSGESLAFVNSWGRGWGDHGLGVISREYFERYFHEAWLSRNARYGITRFTYDRLQAAASDTEFRRAWQRENPRWRLPVVHGGRRLRYVVYETISVEEGCPVEIIELRNPVDIRLGWAFLYHSPASKTAVVKELFVWPPYRRRGYGSLIEAAILERARAWGANKIAINFYEADAIVQSRAAGRLFARQAGYQWRWQRTRRPDIAGVAEKST